MSGESPGSKHMTTFDVPDSKDNSSEEEERGAVNVRRHQHAPVISDKDDDTARRLSHTTISVPAKKARPTPGQEEKRLLGDYETPQDAVPIAVPSNDPPRNRMKALHGNFQPLNTLKSGSAGIGSFRTQKHPITYSTKGQGKRSRPQSTMGPSSGLSDKPFNLHSEDVDEPSNKRVKQDRATKTQEPIEVSSGASDESDDHVAVSRMTKSSSGSTLTAQMAKSKNAGRIGGLSDGVEEYQRVEEMIRVRAPTSSKRVYGGRRRNTQSPMGEDFGAEDISSTDSSSPRASEPQRRLINLETGGRGSMPSDSDGYRGTAGCRMSRRQLERQKGVTNSRSQHPAAKTKRSTTKSPYFIPQQDRSESKPVDSGMKGKDVTIEEREVVLLSPRQEAMRQAPQRTAEAALKCLGNLDAGRMMESLRVSSNLDQRTGVLQPLESLDSPSASSADKFTAVSRDSWESDLAAKPDVNSSAPDSVATVGNITPTTFTNSGSKGVLTINGKRFFKGFPNFRRSRYEIKSLYIDSEHPISGGSDIRSTERTNSYLSIDKISKNLNLLKRDSATNQEGEEQIEPLSNIFKIDYSQEDTFSCGAILNTRNTLGRTGPRIWIGFMDHEELADFVGCMRATSPEIRFERRKETWMANLRQNILRAHESRPSLSPLVKDKGRVTDLLQDDEDRKRVSEGHRSPQPQILNKGLEHDKEVKSKRHCSGMNEEATPETRRRSSLPRIEKEPVISDNSYYTRSRNRQPNTGTVRDSDSDILKQAIPEIEKYSKTVGLPKEWALPLVYPLEGPRKATVDWIDLERLDEGEFLNDNLISFYLRFLEHRLEDSDKSTAQKVYIFNTFFYARLTSGGHGHRSFNFEAVAKWTSKIDIFSYDYVVVPINESAHWYLAIICNLPKLVEKKTRDDSQTIAAEVEHDVSSERRKSDQTSVAQEDEGEGMEIDMTETDVFRTTPTPMDIDEPTNLATTDDGLETDMTNVNTEKVVGVLDPGEVSPNSSLTEIHTAPQVSPISVGSPKTPHVSDDKEIDKAVPTAIEDGEDGSKKVTSSQRRKKKSAPNPKKYDVDSTVILTLDSLGLPHSVTIKNLKQYLVEEAKSKRQLEIDVQDICGMTAKQIPEQDNFCDCGLFLLGYMEKFLRNPRDLVSNILQRNLNVEKDWPDMIPTQMRKNIRDILIDMGNEQEQARKAAHKEEAKRRGKYHAAERGAIDTKSRKLSKESMVSVGDTPTTPVKSDGAKESESKGDESVEKAAERPTLNPEESVIIIHEPSHDDDVLSSGRGMKSSIEVVISNKST